jgi:ubiquinone/menaquinone biosynthesis C-methylase UbiE
MKKGKLGLPTEYKKRPEYFDAFNINNDTDAKNAVIEKLLREQKVRTVLDMTCGTGSQVFHLIKHGYQVTGSDFSPALLDIAREKARSAKLVVTFIDGDMRTLKVGTFDAIISIFNAVGHLTKAGFEKAMRNIHRNLKYGGVYVFDILNLGAMTDELVAGFSYHIHAKHEDSQMHGVQCSTLDKVHGRLISYNDDIIQKGAGIPTHSRSKCELQLYTAQELQEMLARNGFRVLAHYGMEGEAFIHDKTISILTVAQKI